MKKQQETNNQKKRKTSPTSKKKMLALSALYVSVFTLLVLFARVISTSKVDTQSKASPRQATIHFDSSKSYGQVDLSYGVIVSSALGDDLTQDLINYFGQHNIYLKIIDPNPSIFSNPNFDTLSSKGFRWYFTFSNNSQVQNFLSSYYSKYSDSVVVELSQLDASFITNLKATYPSIKIHVGNFVYWPREQVKEILSQLSTPTIEAISFKVKKDNLSDTFSFIRLMFDTFFDASSDIPGTSGIKLNFPEDLVLSLSDVDISSKDLKKLPAAYTGIIGGAITNEVQHSPKPKKAPIKYIIAGDFSNSTPEVKLLMQQSSSFVKSKPDLIWPMAISPNCNPWDNEFIPESNSLPIVGVMGKGPSGYQMLMANTSSEDATANFSQDISLTNLEQYSSTGGKGNYNASSTSLNFSSSSLIIAGSSIPDLLPDGTYVPPSEPVPTSVLPTSVVYPTDVPTSFPTTSQPTTAPQQATEVPNEVIRVTKVIRPTRLPKGDQTVPEITSEAKQALPTPTPRNIVKDTVDSFKSFWINLYTKFVQFSEKVMP